MDQRAKNFTRFYCQSGGGVSDFPVYQGVRNMRGHGFLGRLLRRVGLPLWRLLGRQTVNAGYELIDEAVNKRKGFKESLKDKGRMLGREALNAIPEIILQKPEDGESLLQDGSGFGFPNMAALRKKRKTRRNTVSGQTRLLQALLNTKAKPKKRLSKKKKSKKPKSFARRTSKKTLQKRKQTKSKSKFSLFNNLF